MGGTAGECLLRPSNLISFLIFLNDFIGYFWDFFIWMFDHSLEECARVSVTIHVSFRVS